MKYTAISPDGRVVIAEITECCVKISRRANWDSPEECIECEDKSGIEEFGVEMALEKWWKEGWTITAEE